MPQFVQAESGCIIGVHYPSPIVDHSVARENVNRLYTIKRSVEAKAETAKIVVKHASRKRTLLRKRSRGPDTAQIESTKKQRDEANVDCDSDENSDVVCLDD
mmetsp:Transcript_19550/g.50068  ORF Transcript_19550/g.50068 Transcript_19550/m.50068 type:complete len:102 (-) Transcript_19550:170-475(-)